MIRIYGGSVTEGAEDGTEVGTAENPILFDGLYPGFGGEASKKITFAIRTDGEIIPDICLIVGALDSNATTIEPSPRLFKISGAMGYSILAINACTLLFKQLHGKNQVFKIEVTVIGSEDAAPTVDLRGKLYIIPITSAINTLS